VPKGSKLKRKFFVFYTKKSSKNQEKSNKNKNFLVHIQENSLLEIFIYFKN
jgi:hypothetical protein